MVYRPEDLPNYREDTLRAQIESLERTEQAILGQIGHIEKQRSHDKNKERDAMLEIMLGEQNGMLADTKNELERLNEELIEIMTASGKISG